MALLRASFPPWQPGCQIGSQNDSANRARLPDLNLTLQFSMERGRLVRVFPLDGFASFMNLP